MNTITVEKRDFSVKAKHLRQNGYIPGSVFGGSLEESISLQINTTIAQQLVRGYREGSRLTLQLNEQSIPVQLKERTIDPLSNEILHISFQALKAGQAVNSVIHVVLINADKVTATLEKGIDEIPYTSLPKDMVDSITIDVDGMPMGTMITIGDIPELNNEKLNLKMDKNEIILRIRESSRGGESTTETVAE